MRLQGAVRSPFMRAIAMLSGGQVIAIAIPILAAPILGRLYTPADYGALAQYMAPAAVLGVVACLQFQHAIIAEGSDRTAGAVAWLCIMTAVGVGAVVALGVAALWSPMLAGSTAGRWFFLLPITVVGAGVTAAGSFLANRHRRYRWIATMQVANVATTVALSIALGFQSWGADGLLTAYFLGQGIQVGGHLWLLALLRDSLRFPSLARLRVLVRRHWKFPAFTLPSEFSGQINMQAPIFALSGIGADATLGAFARARQLVSMPITLLSGAVAQVFRREAAELYRTTGSCRALMLRTAGGLLLAGIGPCLLFMVFAPWLFTVYLGSSWREAGEVARMIAPAWLLAMVVSPVSTIFYIANRQKEDFLLSIISSVIIFGSIISITVIMNDPSLLIAGYSVALSIVYIMYLFTSIIISARKK
jgi:O-antigen/teichoic acid export membrane protein